MKQILALIATGIVFSFASCNNSQPVNDETKTKEADAAAPAKAAEPPVFKPFTVTIVHHKVKDFDKWLTLYQAHDSVRKAYGLTEIGLGRGLDNNNEITVAFKADDVQKAKEFVQLPSLKEAMQKGGVTGLPAISFITVIRDDNSAIEQKERLMISHHVKDFDAWVKVFDSEGKEARAANGLIDRGLARGVDDPNMVYVLFAVTDMAKAKARSNSPELKKLMTDAGVDGPPTINFYKLVK